MPFQFSMKWVLAAMAYAAVAAAAYTQRVGVYVDLLWGSSVVAFTYAVLVARHAEGERQAWATGFAVLWLCTNVSSDRPRGSPYAPPLPFSPFATPFALPFAWSVLRPSLDAISEELRSGDAARELAREFARLPRRDGKRESGLLCARQPFLRVAHSYDLRC